MNTDTKLRKIGMSAEWPFGIKTMRKNLAREFRQTTQDTETRVLDWLPHRHLHLNNLFPFLARRMAESRKLRKSIIIGAGQMLCGSELTVSVGQCGEANVFLWNGRCTRLEIRLFRGSCQD
jgi:hypothetical protein